MKKYIQLLILSLFLISGILFIYATITTELEGYQGKGNSGKGIEINRPRQFGAIALPYSTQAWGSSFNYPSKRDAEKDALNRCKESGATDCDIVLSFNNTCGALALKAKSDNKNNGGWGSSTGNKETAEEWALTRCKYYGGDQCKIVESVCSQ